MAPFAEGLSIVQLLQAQCCCDHLLQTLDLASCMMSSTGEFSWEAALPAVAAAVRMVLTGLQTCSSLQQHQEQAQRPLQGCNNYTAKHHRVALQLLLAVALAAHSAGTPQSPPGVDDLLLSPELLPFLATMLLVTVSGLQTSTGGSASAAATSASAGSRGRGAGSSIGPQLPSSQLQQCQHAKSSTPAGGYGGSSSGVRVESLSALSCSLFDILGVSKGTAMQAAQLAKSAGLTKLHQMEGFVSIYSHVSNIQVSDDQDASCFCTRSMATCPFLMFTNTT
jgi:hypothetical protein